MTLIPFDDRDGFIWFDGRMVPWRDAKIHILSHGLHYASCVFEGERVYDGAIFKLRDHSARLLESARILGFTLPYSVEQIDLACRETVAANRIGDGYARPIAWRGSEQMGVAAPASRIHLAVAVWPWPSYFDPAAKARGLRLDMAEYRRPAPDTAPWRSKASGLYMICTISKHIAEARGYADALMLDWRGFVAEATGANVFFVRDGQLHTPIADCFLAGITRRTVMELARARGIGVVERHIRPEELAGFDECFLTGSAAEVTPVAEVGDYRFQPGAVTQILVRDYESAVRCRAAA